MMTFKQFAGKLETIPASTSWYLADLGEARGRQAVAPKLHGEVKRVIPRKEGNKRGNVSSTPSGRIL
jgi:hypothetical protein